MKQGAKSNCPRDSKEKKAHVPSEKNLDQQWAEFDAEVGKIVDERLTSEQLDKEWKLWSEQAKPKTAEQAPKPKRSRRS